MYIKKYSQFLLDKAKDQPDAPLRLRVKWNSQIVSFALGFRVDVSKWNQETQRCKISTTHGAKKIPASVINKEVGRFADAVDLVFASFESSGKVPTAEEFRVAFNRELGRQSHVVAAGDSFFEVFDRFVGEMGQRNGWSKATHTKFGAIRMHLLAFDPGLSFAKLSDQSLHGFVQYQHGVPLRNTTISKNVAFVRWFLRWAANNGFYSGKSHETFRPKLKGVDGNSKEVIHLSWPELMGLLSFEFPEDRQSLSRVRDVFCFCCFTGLRYSDAAKLRRSDVRDGFIMVVTQKTADSLKIELNKYSRAILSKYADFPFPDDLALPVVSNAKMNEHLKEMGEVAGLSDPTRVVYFMGSERHEEVFPKFELLTTHCGRRTFVVNALTLGIPAEVIMRFTGHSDFKAMKPYMKIVDSLKAQEMAKFDR